MRVERGVKKEENHAGICVCQKFVVLLQPQKHMALFPVAEKVSVGLGSPPAFPVQKQKLTAFSIPFSGTNLVQPQKHRDKPSAAAKVIKQQLYAGNL